jgi:hypothetical protein
MLFCDVVPLFRVQQAVEEKIILELLKAFAENEDEIVRLR